MKVRVKILDFDRENVVKVSKLVKIRKVLLERYNRADSSSVGQKRGGPKGYQTKDPFIYETHDSKNLFLINL